MDHYEILRCRPREGETALMTLAADNESTATTCADVAATEAGVAYVCRVTAQEMTRRVSVPTVSARWAGPAVHGPYGAPRGNRETLSWSVPAENTDHVAG